MMGVYKAPVTYTVELVMSGPTHRVTWEFSADVFGDTQSKTLYDELTRTRGVIRCKDPDYEGKYTIGVNRVVWDKHPSHDDAVGMILNQQGWQEE